MRNDAARRSSGRMQLHRQRQKKIIEKPDIKVVDGRLTPEVLEAFGRISGSCSLSRWQKVIFTLTYSDIEENRGMPKFM